jgi:cobalt-zinc-cadmium efflux system protein
LSCHLVIDDIQMSESELILNNVNQVLADRFHIHHTTVQFEHKRCAAADMCAATRPDPAMARGVH